ncbi:response regulator [Antarctobacter jejuensis]|uniref:response regulator n=1 Tax=Antarctobacter jejuensis TaxID=1439938 RepID=UPI003FD1AC50
MIGTLMIIDDNVVDQKLYARLIKRSGRVTTLLEFLMATDALEFLAKPDCPAIDVILLDINMPRMNGFEFLEAATARFGPGFAKAAVIMLTTSISDQDRKRAAQFDVVRDYFQKPLLLEHLDRIEMLSRDAAA